MSNSVNNNLGNFFDAQAVSDRLKHVSADATLDVNDNFVHVEGHSAAVAITLPPVNKCAGRIFGIAVLTASDVNNVTVQDQDDSLAWTDQVVNGANGGSVFLFCDGQKFWVLSAA